MLPEVNDVQLALVPRCPRKYTNDQKELLQEISKSVLEVTGRAVCNQATQHERKGLKSRQYHIGQ